MVTQPTKARTALARYGGAVVIAVAATTSVNAPAQAAPLDLTCTGNIEHVFDEPLSAGGSSNGTTQGSLVNCLSPNGSWPALNSAKITSSFRAKSAPDANPCSLQLTLSRVAGTFTWNTGEVSDYVGSVNTDPRQGVVEINFKVKNGPLSGDTGTVAPVVARTNADCLTVGLRTLDLEAFQIVFQ